ncbi:serine hydrolase [Aerococcaceae bacterium INB8]|uniref:Serine hydrolase n=1 Tax=Ruoffia halotolerans TaxID=2748684 RepID=A0A839A4Y7_9LACT|nr:serine hydrolase [Ruoffia halotolerans]MBA5728665.1 serine hydrolase [Ruoffia halotolerans]
MQNNQNLRWGLIILVVLGFTFVLYLNYDSKGEAPSKTSTQEVSSQANRSSEETIANSSEASSQTDESEQESESDVERTLDVDTTNQSNRVAVVPSQSSEESESSTENSSDEESTEEDEVSIEISVSSSESESQEEDETSESDSEAIVASSESSSEDESTEEDETSNAGSESSSASSESSSQDESQEDESTESSSESELTFDDIYQTYLMDENGIEPLDLDAYKNMADVIDQTLTEFNVNSSEISLAYYNFHNEEHYYLNENELFTAASITKVPLSALYIDLINSGEYQLDSELDYSEALFEAGAGNITNGPLESSYRIEELIAEAITHSDNTAMNILKAEYDKEFGNFREDILTFAGIDEKPEDFLNNNLSSAYITEQVLIKIAQDESYNDLINLMFETSPAQLFTSYVNNEMMANKFGRYEQAVNDSGIYYENNQPQYALVVLSDNINQADQFLEVMNLRVNQWFRAHN